MDRAAREQAAQRARERERAWQEDKEAAEREAREAKAAEAKASALATQREREREIALQAKAGRRPCSKRVAAPSDARQRLVTRPRPTRRTHCYQVPH